MAINIPQTLEELEQAVKRENPVNIAGYGRESTHKGYLSWILNSDRNPNASQLVRCLLSYSNIAAKIEFAQVDCAWEVRIGNHKVDLVIILYDNEKNRLHIPIELKTDSGPSGETQFKEMSDYISSHKEYLPGFVFRLGSSSAQNCDLFDFKAITHEDLISIWEPYYDTSLSFFKDWMDSLAIEAAKKRLAPDVYVRNQECRDIYYNYGYRSSKNMMYYVYDKFREFLKLSGHNDRWWIYDGGYNAVFNHYPEIDNWGVIDGLDGLTWFFEFNDDEFCFKVHYRPKDIAAANDWIINLKSLIRETDNSTQLKAKITKTSSRKGEWIKVAGWDIGFIDFAVTYSKVNEIMNIFGQNGVLGRLSKG